MVRSWPAAAGAFARRHASTRRLVPLVAGLADLVENAGLVVLAAAYPAFSPMLSALVDSMTFVKTALLALVVIAAPVIALLDRVLRGRRDASTSGSREPSL